VAGVELPTTLVTSSEMAKLYEPLALSNFWTEEERLARDDLDDDPCLLLVPKLIPKSRLSGVLLGDCMPTAGQIGEGLHAALGLVRRFRSATFSFH
jgi:hypothetical protein